MATSPVEQPFASFPPPPEGFKPMGVTPTQPSNVLEIPQVAPPPGFQALQVDQPSGGPFDPRPEIINSIIHQESGGRPTAIGKKGEVGLMQVMPATARSMGYDPEALKLNPQLQREAGTRYYADMLKRYKGNEFLALVAYNEGPGNVDKGRMLPQSVKYATAILDRAGSRLAGGARSRGMPFSVAQLGGEMAPPSPAPPPTMLGRLGGALSGLLGEGTAYAEEAPPNLPPPPEGFRPLGTPMGPQPEAAAAPPAGETPPGMAPPPPGFAPPAAPPPGPPAGMMAPPPLPNNLAGNAGTPIGSRIGLHLGPITATVGPETTQAEASKEQALRRQAWQISQLGQEMQDLYEKRLKPKLDSGAIHSLGEGLIYTNRDTARGMGYNIDPDVEDWIVKSGQFSQALNAYYAAGGGGRAGVQFYGEVTSPHVPHPPQGIRELLGVWSPTGQQWDLQQQGEQLPYILHNLRRDAGVEGSQTYSSLVKLPSGKLYDPATGQYWNP